MQGSAPRAAQASAAGLEGQDGSSCFSNGFGSGQEVSCLRKICSDLEVCRQWITLKISS
jgi:hypothetical protein